MKPSKSNTNPKDVSNNYVDGKDGNEAFTTKDIAKDGSTSEHFGCVGRAGGEGSGSSLKVLGAKVLFDGLNVGGRSSGGKVRQYIHCAVLFHLFWKCHPFKNILMFISLSL